MMYCPESFKEKDLERIIELAHKHAFATVITVDDKGPQANLIPLLVEKQGKKIRLRGHMARANPQWQQFNGVQEVLVIFHGPHSYISPNYYEERGVPTWNYAAVQMRGPATVLEEAETLREIMEQLSAKYEQSQPIPWEMQISERSLSAAIGFEIEVTKWEAKFKLSQNRSVVDQQKIIATLTESHHANEKELAQLMANYLR